MPCIVLLVIFSLGAIAAVTDQVRCLDAARATARMIARGDDQAVALDQGRRLAPAGAQLEVHGSVGEVEVRVVGSPARALGWLGLSASPNATAVAAWEQAPTTDVVSGARP